MELIRSEDGKTLCVRLTGEADASIIAKIEGPVAEASEDVAELIFDLEELEYISSAGIRFLLKMHNSMKGRGTMTIKHVSEDVMDILRITGVVPRLNIV